MGTPAWHTPGSLLARAAVSAQGSLRTKGSGSQPCLRSNMGSVGEDYRCPCCGRVGNGGYVMDGYCDFPVCTEGEHSCLERLYEGLARDAPDILKQALECILRGRVPHLKYVAEFLIEY